MNQPEEWKQTEAMQSFDELEQELRKTLGRVDPPAGFAERTMARIAADQRRPEPIPIFARARRRVWLTGALAAALLVGVFAGEQAREARQRSRAEQAQKQFEAALQVTDRALDHAREQLQQAGVQVGD